MKLNRHARSALIVACNVMMAREALESIRLLTGASSQEEGLALALIITSARHHVTRTPRPAVDSRGVH